MRFRHQGMWHVDPDAYWTEGNFVTYDPRLPSALIAELRQLHDPVLGPALTSHFRIVAHHLQAVRTPSPRTRIPSSKPCISHRELSLASSLSAFPVPIARRHSSSAHECCVVPRSAAADFDPFGVLMARARSCATCSPWRVC